MSKLLRCLFIVGLLFIGTAPINAVTFEWSVIDDPGNLPNFDFGVPVGGLPYLYRIAKHEVTNGQYAEFLNAVDDSGENLDALYNVKMGTDAIGGIEFVSGARDGAKYVTKPNMADKPVNYVSYFDAMRFVNWIENDQPNNGGGTEFGVYVIDDGTGEARVPTSFYFLPNENEWYKAGYFDPRSEAEGGPAGDDNYWLYPTLSDDPPTLATANEMGDVSNPGPNVANLDRGADWNGLNGNVTTIGSAGSASYYGIHNMAGNVAEWGEQIDGSKRGVRGGSYDNFDADGSMSDFLFPETELPNLGFRIGSLFFETCGDFDRDTDIDTADRSTLVQNWTGALQGGGEKTFFDGDCNEDGDVDADDLTGLVQNWTGAAQDALSSTPSTSVVPEPTSSLLLLCGVMTLMLRRRVKLC